MIITCGKWGTRLTAMSRRLEEGRLWRPFCCDKSKKMGSPLGAQAVQLSQSLSASFCASLSDADGTTIDGHEISLLRLIFFAYADV